jgi:hypothetical protein
MPLPHFVNIPSHNNKWEPVFKNLFEVEIILPELIGSRHPNASELLLHNATKTRLPVYPTQGNQTQRYKYSTRLFVGFPDSTSITDLGITFNVNQDDNKQLFTFRIIKDWYDLVWNNEDGSSHYKKNVVGDIILYQHDREGEIIRRITYHNCQITGFQVGEELVWGGGAEIQELTATWLVDWWEDYYF